MFCLFAILIEKDLNKITKFKQKKKTNFCKIISPKYAISQLKLFEDEEEVE